MNENPLGKIIFYSDSYDPNVLYFIPRDTNREKNGINKIYFSGYDIWNCYEFSYLNKKGKPEVKILQIIYNCKSKNIVESKSLKLYLNSFNMTKFNNEEEIISIIKNDLKSKLITDDIIITMYNYDDKKFLKKTKINPSLLIDNYDIIIKNYNLNPNLLETKYLEHPVIIEKYSNLLKTNCPITNQPDWGTVYIKCKSNYLIDDTSLLRYIISYRNHKDYHESCCENIFNDIYNITKPIFLIVKCFFTRRGGIDINSARFYGIKPDKKYYQHYWRQ